MKKLLGIIVLGLMLVGNAYANWLPDKDKDFFISCVAKGYFDMSYKQQRYTETLLDEYKITIGESKFFGRRPKSALIVNTNATKQNDFPLRRNKFDQTLSYSDRVLVIDEIHFQGKFKVHQEAVISLISGAYEVFYKDTLTIDDTVQFKGTGNCEGLVPILSYLENNKNDGNDKNGGSSGTAFFINKKGYLLTNNHVVDGCTLSKISYKNKDYDTKLIATDKTLDLALLKSELKPETFFNFSKNETKKLNTIYVAGYPLGKGLSDDLKISSGIVSSLKGFEDNSNEIQIDAPINSGNSGGPIINENGDLIAIAVSGLAKDQTEGINFGIKSSAAERFLKSNNININKSFYSRSKNKEQLRNILEEGTVYTYCN